MLQDIRLCCKELIVLKYQTASLRGSGGALNTRLECCSKQHESSRKKTVHHFKRKGDEGNLFFAFVPLGRECDLPPSTPTAKDTLSNRRGLSHEGLLNPSVNLHGPRVQTRRPTSWRFINFLFKQVLLNVLPNSDEVDYISPKMPAFPPVGLVVGCACGARAPMALANRG